jgi:hypothetical protein
VITRFVFSLGLLLAASFSVQADKIIRVVDVAGNVDSLRAEIHEANRLAETHFTALRLSGDFQFGPHDSLPDIAGSLTLRGPARLIGGGSGESSHLGDDKGPGYLFRIGPEAMLRLESLEISDFSLNHDSDGLIVNSGSLHLEEVQFARVAVGYWCVKFCTPAMPMIANLKDADLLIYRVSMVNSGISSLGYASPFTGGLIYNKGEVNMAASQVYLEKYGWARSFHNSGSFYIRNSSFLFRDAGGEFENPLFGIPGSSPIRIVNSIVSGFDGATCQEAISDGFNLNDSAGCAWSSPNDLVGIPTGVHWRPVTAHWLYSRDQILTNAIVPMASSPAVDSANADWCDSNSLLRNGRFRGEGCDRGAVETVKVSLGEGGINGLYFNPDADGHYVQLLETDFLTLVIWNTFDKEGNHVWVYGTGQLVDGKSVIADTYINRGVMVLPGVPVEDAETEHWGVLEVELTSCKQGLVSFKSVDPKFGSGQFPIERLAYVKQLGCAD